MLQSAMAEIAIVDPGSAIHNPAGERHGGGVAPGEEAADKAELNVGEGEIFRDSGKGRKKELPIDIINGEGEGEKCRDPPGAGGWRRFGVGLGMRRQGRPNPE